MYYIVSYLFYIMKKRLIIALIAIVLVVIVCILIFREDNTWNIMDWPGMVNDVSSYSVKTSMRNSMPWEDIYVYDENDKLVLSLNDENQPQYLYALYENFLILDSWTSASQRDMLVYDIPTGNKVFQTNYFPWEKGLVLNGNEITFYKKIDDSLLWNYTLPQCEGEYDNGYIEKYGYTIWEDQVNDLGDIQCTYFE